MKRAKESEKFALEELRRKKLLLKQKRNEEDKTCIICRLERSGVAVERTSKKRRYRGDAKRCRRQSGKNNEL